MTTARVLADYQPRYADLYAETTRACHDASTPPFSLPAYLRACDERDMVARVLLALYSLREQVAA